MCWLFVGGSGIGDDSGSVGDGGDRTGISTNKKSWHSDDPFN